MKRADDWQHVLPGPQCQAKKKKTDLLHFYFSYMLFNGHKCPSVVFLFYIFHYFLIVLLLLSFMLLHLHQPTAGEDFLYTAPYTFRIRKTYTAEVAERPHPKMHTSTPHVLLQHIWFTSWRRWTHGNTHGSSLKRNCSPHSNAPSVLLFILLSLFYPPPPTHTHRYSNVHQLCAPAGCQLINRSDGEQRRRTIKSVFHPPSSLLALNRFALSAKPGGVISNICCVSIRIPRKL